MQTSAPIILQDPKNGFFEQLFINMNIQVPTLPETTLRNIELPQYVFYMEQNRKISGLFTSTSTMNSQEWILFLTQFRDMVEALYRNTLVSKYPKPYSTFFFFFKIK
jgi:hypothetical protein